MRTTANRADRPMLLELRSSTWFITLTVCVAIFADMFLYSVVVPVFPFSLVSRIHVPEQDSQHWVSVLLSVYGAALLVGAPVFGFFADQLHNRRMSLLIGLVALTGATAVLCLATSLPVLIAGRVLQGLSASITWVVGLTLLAETAKKETVAQSFGYVGAASSLGTVIAPVLGGAVYNSVGYYPVFAMCFAFLGVDMLLRLAVIEKKTAARWSLQQTNDHTVISTVRAPPNTNPVIQDSTISNSADAEVAAACPQFPSQSQSQSHHETSAKKLPAIFRLWKSPRLLVAFWGDFVTATVMTAFDTTLALFVKHTFHWSSLQAGLTFLALLLPTIFGPIFGFIADKYGGRWISALGFIVMGPPLILLRLITHGSVGQIVLLCALLLLVGLGAAMALTGLYAEYSKICDDIEAEQPGSLGANGGYAQCYGISEIAWALAGLISPLVSGEIYETANWGTLGWFLSLFCFITVVPTLLFVNSKCRVLPRSNDAYNH